MSFTEVTVSRKALLNNIRQFRKLAGEAQVLCVVKSEAYGHGLETVARAIEKETDWLGTASLDEALRLRQMGVKKPILVLSFYDIKRAAEAVSSDISLVVYDLNQAKVLDAVGKRLGKKAKVHLKIDTGTSRLGVLASDFLPFAKAVAVRRNIVIEGVMSHFSSSEEDVAYTEKQFGLFESAVAEIADLGGINPKYYHIACTAAGMVAPASKMNFIRLGIGLYGLWPSLQAKNAALKKRPSFRLRPALSWKTKIVQIKNLPAGCFVGYGKTFMTKRHTKLAVLPVGYYDGYDRKLSNLGNVLVRGKRCRVLGRVCMNLTMIDVTEVKGVKVFDEAVLIGRQGKENITTEELAKVAGTINYEIVARINPLIPRKIIN